MKVVADTSSFLAVALLEPERDQIILLTQGHELVAPEILPYEIGDALTAMLKRRVLSPHQVLPVWEASQQIPVELRRVDMPAALALASDQGIYAYDAYFLECALSLRVPLLTLDGGMKYVARQLGIALLEELQ